MAHAELEQARERAGRRHADNQALQDAELGMGLHDPHQPHDRRADIRLSASSGSMSS